MGLLGLLGGGLNFPFEEKRLSRLPADHGLSPELVNFSGQISPDAFGRRGQTHIHRPETPVAGAVPQVVRGVGGAEEHTAPGQLLDMAAIGRTETVRPQGEKLLDARHIRLAESVQFTDLHQPDPLQKLRGLLALKGADAVIKPAPAHLIQQGALANALGPGQDEHVVILAAGHHGTGDGGGESLAGHRSGVGAVLRPQVVNEKGVQAGHAVPLEALEVVLDLIESVLCGMEGEGPVNLAVAGDVVDLFHVPVEAVVVIVIPEAALGGGVPGERIQHLTTARKLVEGKLALEQRVILKNNPDIINGGLGEAGLAVDLKPVHPVGGLCIVGGLHALKVLDGLLVALLAHQGGHIGVLRGQFAHGTVGGQAVGGGARLGLIVLVTKAMQAHQVKGVYQLAAARVSGVVGVEKLAAVIDDSAAGGGAAQVGVAARHTLHRLIHAGDEFIHGTIDVIGAAESAHNTVFGLRVTLLDCQLGGQVLGAGDLGPEGAVTPVLILAQQALDGQQGLVFPHIDVLAV